MVQIQRMVVFTIARAERAIRGRPPPWAEDLFLKLLTIERKVNLIMALDTAVIHRILVGAQFLADRDKANQAKIQDLQSKLDAAGAAEAAEDAAEADANAAAAKVADEVDALVKGPDTPTVEVPSDPQAVVDVVSGDTPATVTDPGPSADPAV